MTQEAFLKRAKKKYGRLVGKTFGKLKVTGLILGIDRRGLKEARATYECECGRKGDAPAWAIEDSDDYSGKDCQECLRRRTEQAKANPQVFTEEQIRKVNNTLKGVIFRLTDRGETNVVQDIISSIWEKLMTIPDLSQRPMGQIIVAAANLARPYAKQMLREHRDEEHVKLKVHKDPETGDWSDIFDDLLVPQINKLDVDDLKAAALESLTPEEKHWLLTRSPKERLPEYDRLVTKVREAYAELVCDIGGA